MQIVCLGDNLHEMSMPVFWEGGKKKKRNINLLSADFAYTVIRVNLTKVLHLCNNDNNFKTR